MKKYIQLCLVLVAGLCFVLMAFYERKYTHLQTIVRFMSWPANPSNRDCHSVHCQSDNADNTGSIQWLEAASGIYTYSAFLWRNQTRVQVISLRHSNSDNTRLMCSFFHNGGTDLSNVYARTLPMRQFGDWNLNLLVCPTNKEKNHSQLNGVSLSVTDADPEWMLNFLESNTRSNVSTSATSSLVFCVKPLPVGFSDVARLIEFIELAKLAGADKFVFYHRGLGMRVRQLLNVEIHNGFVQLFPFFLPFGTPVELTDGVAQLDCFLRHSVETSKAKIVQIGLNEFFTPTGDKNIQSALPAGFSGLVTFKTFVYCMEVNDDVVARTLHFPFLTLRKMKRLKDPTIQSLLVMEAVDSVKNLKIVKDSLDPQKISSLPSTGALSRNKMLLRHYGKCKQNRISRGLVSDSYMMKFKEQLFKKLQMF